MSETMTDAEAERMATEIVLHEQWSSHNSSILTRHIVDLRIARDKAQNKLNALGDGPICEDCNFAACEENDLCRHYQRHRAEVAEAKLERAAGLMEKRRAVRGEPKPDNEAAIKLLQSWLYDESGYDERVWPIVEEVLQRRRPQAVQALLDKWGYGSSSNEWNCVTLACADDLADAFPVAQKGEEDD